MIKNLKKDKNYFYVEITGMITREDVESVIPVVNEIIAEYKKMKGLVYLNDVKGYTFAGFLADFNFYLKHEDYFEYMAIVGDKGFEKEMVNVFDKLMPGKAKYFDTSELGKAKEWIKNL